MDENMIPQRKTIIITKNSSNTIDYCNDFCHASMNADNGLNNLQTYSNHYPPAANSVSQWSDLQYGMSKLKNCLDYMDSNKEWFGKGLEWPYVYGSAKLYYNQLCNMQQYQVNDISECIRKINNYTSELSSIMLSMEMYKNKENEHRQIDNKIKKLVAVIVGSFLLALIFPTLFSFLIPMIYIFVVYGKNNIFKKDNH